MTRSTLSHPIRVGVQLHPQHTPYQSFADAVRRAEDMGVDTIWDWDHFSRQARPILSWEWAYPGISMPWQRCSNGAMRNVHNGYPVDPIGKGQKKRKPLGEVAHRERWGEAFA